MAPKKHEKVDKKVEIIVDKKSHLLKKPFSMLVAGSSMAGKTTDILSWLINPENFFETPFEKILYITGSGMQKSFQNPGLEDVLFSENINDLKNLKHTEGGTLVVLDDLLSDMANDKQLVDICTKTVHHANVSLIFLSQTVFVNTGPFKILKDNLQYVYLKHFSGQHKLKYFALQLGINPIEFMTAYNHIMSKFRYSGLFIDLNIRSNLRLLSPLRYSLLKKPQMLISEADFKKNLENGFLTKNTDGVYTFKPKILDA